jgi:molybdopterin molybdotransferase
MVRAEPPAGGHIRPAGDDISEGDMVVASGSELGPGELALLASLGLSPVPVHRRPKIAIVTTGDELVSPEEEPGPGRIRDSNTTALHALAEQSGGVGIRFKGVADDLDALIDTFREAADSADLVVSAGGVSVGRYDFVKAAVEHLGSIDLWRVAMQPGKPVVSGNVLETPFLGLPGNPVSIHIGFEQFVRPAIRKLRGCRGLLRPVLRARLTEGLSKRPGRLHFVRVRLEVGSEGIMAVPTGGQGSHIQSSLIGCHGVARFAIEEKELPAGAEVEVEVWILPDGDRFPS